MVLKTRGNGSVEMKWELGRSCATWVLKSGWSVMVKNAVWFFGSKMVEVGLSAPCQYLPHEVLTPVAQIKLGLSIPAIPSIPTF